MKTNNFEALIETAKNPQRKSELKKDPQKYLKENFDLELPPNSTITVLENTPQKFYFVLPTLNKLKQENLQGTETDLLQKMKELSFREKIKRNPKETIQKETDIEFPQGCQIEVIEETDDHFYLVLPDPTKLDEMTEKEMEAISAGFSKGGGALIGFFVSGIISIVTWASTYKRNR